MTVDRVDTVVCGGQVVISNHVSNVGIAIHGEKIVAIGREELLPVADRYIDVKGRFVLPGLIDCHVHLDKCDSIGLGSKAAAYSGITTLLPFGTYDVESDEDLPTAINRHAEEVNSQAYVDMGFHYILANRPAILKSLPAAMDMGIKSFKMFMTYKKNPTRFCSDDYLCEAMELVSRGGGVMQLHCESGNIIDYLENKLMEEGHTHPTDFPLSCPPWAEEEAINRAVRMGEVTGCPIYVVHLSSEDGLKRIIRAQMEGKRVWTETCPQYLLLSDAKMAEVGPLAKIGPPLREKDGPHQPAMWWGSKNGFISTLASDHSPYPRDLKMPGWDNIFVDAKGKPIPYGAPGIETLVGLAYSEGVVKRGLPIWWLARVMAENPARIFGIYPRKGVIQVGSDADLLVIDPNGDSVVTAMNHHGNSGFSLFEGWNIKGSPWMTLIRGQVVLNQGKLEQKPGYGQWIPCESPSMPVGGPIT
ncbi:MAG: hypothetical protein CL891_01185 [Dehalococcoidia bacterium]|nr:hypothetical protein [Dehalococcoidia bacterium]|tara:strand:- start:1534 stop:2952 length:1419 start_codon:yes stop_codon:yes gene_type:complete